ncbi:MAG: tRNA (adenosine(37)-N6)-threonylcarbamoyltransferase complex dimerization subunit type 1 TsaB [Syntrophaceae bacterium]
MLILAIDTSSKTASIALLHKDEILSEIFINLGVNHSAVLLPALQELLRMSQIVPEKIELFACTEGPGSFTGLRIGVSTVKGLSLATGKPIVGVSTLEALAFNCIGSGLLVCPMMDAKKNQVYTTLYRTGRDEKLEKIKDDVVTDVREFLQHIQEEVMFVGDGAIQYSGIINDNLRGKAYYASPCHHSVRAAAVGLLALSKYDNGDFSDSITFTPRYFRLSEAEVKHILR